MTQPLTEITLTTWFTTWQRTVNQKEIGFIFCPPISGREYRINSFVEWQKIHQLPKAKIVNLLVELIEKPADIATLFKETNQPLIITPAERLLEPGNESLLHACVEYHKKHPIGLLLFAEIFPSTLAQSTLPPSILQNISYLTYADKADSFQFITYLCEIFSVDATNTIAEKKKQTIFQITGGQLWLIKEIVRQWAQGTTDIDTIIQSESYQYKTGIIWQHFPEHIKNYLNEYSKNHTPELNQTSLNQELKRFNIINPTLEKDLPSWITHSIHQEKKYTLTIDNSSFFCNGVIVDSLFTKREKTLLQLFIDRKNELVTKDTIAQTCWQNDEEYSEWAVDQVINRLRKKLIHLGFAVSTLETVKSKGIVFHA